MNEREARFMRVKRLSEEQVGVLHDAERAADARWNEHRDNPALRGDGWGIVGVQKLVEIERVMGPFWDARKPEEERARIISIFLNAPAVRRAFASLETEDKTELELTHAADWRIWKQAPMVGNVFGDAVRSGGADHGR